jgi:hypothetical protein
MKERYESAIKEAKAVLAKAKPAVQTCDEQLNAVVLELLLGQIDEIVKVALDWVRGHGQLYTSADLSKDSARYLSDLVQMGVPPLGKDVRLATVFNVGQILCSDHMAAFCPADSRREKEPRIDALLLKAIELNELATAWDEA